MSGIWPRASRKPSTLRPPGAPGRYLSLIHILPLSALVLALLAIPLSFVNPRAGRSMHLILALLIYVTYSNLTSIAQAMVAQGKVTFAVGLVAVHAVMVLLLLVLFWRRIAVYAWFRMRR